MITIVAVDPIHSIIGILYAYPFLYGEWDTIFMLSPEFICVPDLDTNLAKCASVSRCKNKSVIYSFATLAVCDFDTWQFPRVHMLPTSLSA